MSEEFESLVEKRIREAEERGDFQNLSGRGKPLRGLNESYDPEWWVRNWVEREKLDQDLKEARTQSRQGRIESKLMVAQHRRDPGPMTQRPSQKRKNGNRNSRRRLEAILDWCRKAFAKRPC